MHSFDVLDAFFGVTISFIATTYSVIFKSLVAVKTIACSFAEKREERELSFILKKRKKNVIITNCQKVLI